MAHIIFTKKGDERLSKAHHWLKWQKYRLAFVISTLINGVLIYLLNK